MSNYMYHPIVNTFRAFRGTSVAGLSPAHVMAPPRLTSFDPRGRCLGRPCLLRLQLELI